MVPRHHPGPPNRHPDTQPPIVYKVSDYSYRYRLREGACTCHKPCCALGCVDKECAIRCRAYTEGCAAPSPGMPFDDGRRTGNARCGHWAYRLMREGAVQYHAIPPGWSCAQPFGEDASAVQGGRRPWLPKGEVSIERVPDRGRWRGYCGALLQLRRHRVQRRVRR
jgi:hypothetical protein